MRSKIYWSVAITFIAAIIASCSKSSTPTPLTVTRATLLAGTLGSSKTWQLTSISELDVSGSSSQTNTWTLTSTPAIPSCESDNIFTFSNNTTQDYTQTEGSTQCSSTDPSTLEKGSWGFTNDGKSLLIDGIYYPDQTQFQNEDGNNATSGGLLIYFILNQGTPLTITSISSTSLTLTYTGSYTDSSTSALVNYTVTLIFTAK